MNSADQIKVSVNAKRGRKNKSHPSGCWRSDTSNSTAVDAAIEANPGRVTVHI